MKTSTPSPLEPLLTVEDLATILRKSPDAVRKMAERRQVPHMRIGRNLRFAPSVIHAWLAEKSRASS